MFSHSKTHFLQETHSSVSCGSFELSVTKAKSQQQQKDIWQIGKGLFSHRSFCAVFVEDQWISKQETIFPKKTPKGYIFMCQLFNFKETATLERKLLGRFTQYFANISLNESFHLVVIISF